MYNVSCTALLIALFKLFYAFNHIFIMLFSRSIPVPCLQHHRYKHWMKPFRKPITLTRAHYWAKYHGCFTRVEVEILGSQKIIKWWFMLTSAYIADLGIFQTSQRRLGRGLLMLNSYFRPFQIISYYLLSPKLKMGPSDQSYDYFSKALKTESGANRSISI